jgi:hypothetical protein
VYRDQRETADKWYAIPLREAIALGSLENSEFGPYYAISTSDLGLLFKVHGSTVGWAVEAVE